MCVAYSATQEAGVVDLKVGQGGREESSSYLVNEMECSGTLGTPHRCEKVRTRETVWGERAGSQEM